MSKKKEETSEFSQQIHENPRVEETPEIEVELTQLAPPAYLQEDTTIRDWVEDTLVPEIVALEKEPDEVIYLSPNYPTLKVLYERSDTDENRRSNYLRFSENLYRTTDPQEIALLDTLDSCYRDPGIVYKCQKCRFISLNQGDFSTHLQAHK